MLICCPNANHTFEIADDLIGARVRCPECGDLFFAADSNAQIQAATPKPKEASDLAEKIYDGLPPLSVMMALRRQKGRSYDAADFPVKLEMTDDDWKALAAYESLLWGAYSLRTSVVVALVALLANLPILLVPNGPDAHAHLRGSSENSLYASIGIVFLVPMAILYFGSYSLQRASTRGLVDLLILASFGTFLFFAFTAAIEIHTVITFPRRGLLACLVSIPFNLIAVFDLGRTVFRVSKALHEIEPPEITIRIVEALKYLE